MEEEFLKPPCTMTKLEDNCLKVSASGSTDSVFYCCVLEVQCNDEVYHIARYFEQGCVVGFFANVAHSKLKEVLDVQSILPYLVYTLKDIDFTSTRSTELFKPQRQPGKANQQFLKNRSFERIMASNKSSIDKLMNDLKPSIERSKVKCLFCCCFSLYVNQKWDAIDKEKKTKIMICDREAASWESLLMAYRSNRQQNNNPSLFYNMVLPDSLSIEEQFYVISSIPNCHYWSWGGKLTTDVKFGQRLSTSLRFRPASPRNRIIQACIYRDDADAIVTAVLQVLLGDNNVVIPYPSKSVSKSKRKRKFDKISRNQPTTTINDDLSGNEPLLNFVSEKQTLFSYFCGELFNHGKIIWRIQSPSKHVVVMNDFDYKVGNFLNYDYVIVTVVMTPISAIYHCSCKSFGVGCSTEESSCLHTRVLKAITSIYSSVEQANPDSVLLNRSVIEAGMGYSTQTLVELPAKSSVKKFSIISSESAALVSLFNVSGTDRKVVLCHDSLCTIGKGSKRTFHTLKSAPDSDLCCHLKIFRDGYDGFDDATPSNTEEFLLPDAKWTDIFDETTGMWKFGFSAPSKAKVDNEPFSPELSKHVNARLNYPDDPVFFPDSTMDSCSCGVEWSNNFVVKGTTNLYLDQCVKKALIYCITCSSGSCVRHWDGKENYIFRSSSSTCAGYEIGWNFVDQVQSSAQTFSGFVTCMNNKYKRFNLEGPTFMSVPVFIEWFFSWASHMQIDFREQCSMCNGHCKLLACDATKLGIGFKHTFVKPIEAPEINEVTTTTFRRFNRCFIFNASPEASLYRTARLNLAELCNSILKDGTFNHSIVDDLKKCLPPRSITTFDHMLSSQCSEVERNTLAVFFNLLATDASVDTLIPLCILHSLETFASKYIDKTLNVNDVRLLVHDLKFYCPELSNVILSAAVNNADQLPNTHVIELIQYLVYFVRNIHCYDEPADDPEPIENTYNPARFGRAYYFTPHGNQIRRMRPFTIDEDDKKNHDDDPDSMCDKIFPMVSKKGTSYAFFWFCPAHGHCMGFHIIPESEGRKDAAASLYTHAPIPPDDLFYDFACSLSEYTKNRESGYFSKTRFFHDVFHGFTHKCSKAFRYNRLLEKMQVNTSICEQFNSYIRNIKASAKTMTQAKFMFYVQFFIHFWNKAKKERYAKQLYISKESKK